MPIKKHLFLFLILIFYFYQPVYGQDTQRAYYVKATGNNENNGRSEEQAFKTVSRAISYATAGTIKTIIIIGTLDEIISINNSGTTEIKISGKSNATDRERAHLIRGNVSIRGNSTIHFENISITGGTGSSSNNYGGGISITNGARLIIGEDVLIQNNRAVRGGGINIDNSTCIMQGGEISGNTATGSQDAGGGGVYITGGGTFILENGVIKNNKTGRAGGGVCVHYANFIMNGGSIIDNESSNMGGGIGGWSASRYNLKINGGIISNNKSIGDGGGIAYWGTVEMTNGEISNNSTEYSGGGIQCDILLLTGGIIKNNRANKNGGGILLGMYGNRSEISSGEISDNISERGAGIYVSVFPNSRNTLIIQNGVIKNNRASFLGGGIYISNSNTLQIRNVLIIENNANFLGGGIYLEDGSRFTRSGGTINQNSTNEGEGVDIFQQ